MDDRLLGLLRRWEDIVVEQGVPAAGRLAAGIDQGMVQRVLVGEGLHPDPRVLTVFGWHNGYLEGPVHSHLNPVGAALLSLEQAREAYHRWIISLSEDALPGWFPVMECGQAYLTVDCNPGSATAGAVRLWDSGEHLDPAASLTEVVQTWVRYFQDGTWRWVPNGWVSEVNHQTLPPEELHSGLYF